MDDEFSNLSLLSSTTVIDSVPQLFEFKEDIYIKMAKIGRNENRMDLFLNYYIYAIIMRIGNDFCGFPFLYITKQELKNIVLEKHELYAFSGLKETVLEHFKSSKMLASWIYNFTSEYILSTLVLEKHQKYFQLKDYSKNQIISIIKDNIIQDQINHISSLNAFKTCSTISGLVGYKLNELNSVK